MGVIEETLSLLLCLCGPGGSCYLCRRGAEHHCVSAGKNRPNVHYQCVARARVQHQHLDEYLSEASMCLYVWMCAANSISMYVLVHKHVEMPLTHHMQFDACAHVCISISTCACAYKHICVHLINVFVCTCTHFPQRILSQTKCGCVRTSDSLCAMAERKRELGWEREKPSCC